MNEIPQREYRGYLLRRDPHFMFWSVFRPDGTEVASRFTTITVAQAAIDLLEEMQKAKEGLPEGTKDIPTPTKLPRNKMLGLGVGNVL
jgi:hypothetical protein